MHIMDDLVDTALNELLRFRRSPIKTTQRFKEMKHNKHLCPKIQSKLTDFLEGSRRYHNIAYDVQGPRDRGKDVVLRYGENEEISRYITIQIKSYDDLCKKEYLMNLKAQSLEVQADYKDKLQHHFILICTDVNKHKDQIRAICAEFSNLEWVTVIQPEYMWTFLRLTITRMDAIVQGVLRQDDVVYMKARKMVADHTPVDTAVLLAFLWLVRRHGTYSIHSDELRTIGFLDDVIEYVPDYPRDSFFYEEEDTDDDNDEYPLERYESFEDSSDYIKEDLGRSIEERITETIEALDGNAIHLDNTSDLVNIDPKYVMPLEAIILDTAIRFECEGDDLLRFVFDTLDVARTFDLDFDLFKETD
jgi:hypothetical protein